MTASSLDGSPAGRPLRADAARNHRRIVDTAAAAFESNKTDNPVADDQKKSQDESNEDPA